MEFSLSLRMEPRANHGWMPRVACVSHTAVQLRLLYTASQGGPVPPLSLCVRSTICVVLAASYETRCVRSTSTFNFKRQEYNIWIQ